jgi:hypothetical protein
MHSLSQNPTTRGIGNLRCPLDQLQFPDRRRTTENHVAVEFLPYNEEHPWDSGEGESDSEEGGMEDPVDLD